MKLSLISLTASFALTKLREFPLSRPVDQPDGPNTSVKDGFVFVSDPSGEAAYRYRDMVDEMLSRAWPRKRMAITSPASGEGKTVTAVNVALALAEKGFSVLLVELTLTRPRYRYVFGGAPSLRGVESVLRGEATPEEATFQLGETLVAVSSVSKSMPDHELLGQRENLRRLTEYGESAFDWTILDLPSVEESSEISEIAAEAGPVVMVARSHKTRLDVFRRATSALGSDLDYVILNDHAS
jgi:Mrp family chromosome partitioning ATPase